MVVRIRCIQRYVSKVQVQRYLQMEGERCTSNAGPECPLALCDATANEDAFLSCYLAHQRSKV